MKDDFDRVLELIKFKTHQYAKRQITWINNQMISWNSINTQYSNKNVKEITYPGQNKFNRYKKNFNKEIKITDDIKKDIEKLLN